MGQKEYRNSRLAVAYLACVLFPPMPIQKWKLALLGILLIPCWVIAVKYDVDLVNLYAVVKYSLTDLSKVYAQNGNLGRYFYGPFSVALFQPLAYFSFAAVKGFWIVLQTIFFVIFWKFLHRLYPFLSEKGSTFAWILIFILAINPIHNNFQSNNIQLMLMALVLVAEVWSREENYTLQFLSGILVALCASIKVFPLFLVAFYVLFRNNRTRIGTILGFVGMHLFPFIYFGTDGALRLYRDFVSNLTTYNVENSFTKVPDILCLPSMISRWVSPGIQAGTYPAALEGLLIKGSVLGISAVFFLWVMNEIRKGADQDTRWNTHTWALANTLMALLNPSTRPHYFIFYIPAFCSLFEIAKEHPAVGKTPLQKALIGVSIFLIAFTAQGLTGKELNDTLEFMSLPTFGAVALTVALAITLYRLSDVGDDARAV